MARFVQILRRTRRFRYTLTLLLLFGVLFAGIRSRSQESDPAPEPKATPDAVAGADTASAPEAEAAPEPAPSGQSIPDAALRDKALEFLVGLSKRISKTPMPAPVKLPEDIISLAYPGDENGEADDNLRAELRDEESAGKYIHDLRRHGFVPVKSIRWIKPVAAENSPDTAKEETKADAVVFGIVTVDDKRNPDKADWEPRHRAVKIAFRKAGDKFLISDVARPTARELGGPQIVESLLEAERGGHADAAWASGSREMRAARSPEKLRADLKAAGFLGAESIEWGEETGIEGGYKLHGTADLDGGVKIPFYAALLETADGLKLLDLQSTGSFIERIFGGRGDTLDMTLAVVALALLLGFLYILYSYGRGLKGSPRELYILFFTKVTEYSAYGAAQLAFMFYLREDMGLGEVGAGTYYSAWSTVVTATTMAVGAICDAIGIKKTLLIGSILLLISRAVMPFADNLLVATFFGFLPLGIGIAITGPVLSVGIKRFTTIEGAALGFGLFYTLMNVGWAIGAQLFDFVRIHLGEMGHVEFLGDSLSTWQVLFGIGFFINLPDLAAILWMRDGVEMTERGIKLPDPEAPSDAADKDSSPGALLTRGLAALRAGAVGTVKIFADNFVHRAFWVFILLIGITIFTRLTFFHFHITWPSYGIRYFGKGSLVGNIFGVLNPVIVVFLVPVIAYLTRRVRSYWMLLIGTLISVGSITLVIIPPETMSWLVDTWFGAVVFDRWLEVPVGNRDPYYLSMVLFVMVFTLGEAIWSPRLMQFTAEIAPPGREGSYISLSYLPYFAAKFIVGPMAGLLLANYAPEFGVDGIYGYYPDHQMIWWWVGGSAVLTPLGLIVFRKLYRIAEDRAAKAAEEEAAKVAAAEASGG
jgi:dipeptide/tripeptide permease